MSSPFGTTLRSAGLLLFSPVEAIIISRAMTELAGFMASGSQLKTMFEAVGNQFLFVLILSLVANVAAAAYINGGKGR